MNEWTLGPELESETSDEISSATLRRYARHTLRSRLRKEVAAEVVGRLPDPGESIHVVSNGDFDYWSLVPHALGSMGPSEFHGSTWTMNRGNVLDMFDLYDRGQLTSITLLTGLYFKRRESAVYATVVEGLESRGQWYAACPNHAKVILICDGTTDLVIEGSANFTANPRIENHVITNDRALYDFHKSWMDEIVSRRHVNT